MDGMQQQVMPPPVRSAGGKAFDQEGDEPKQDESAKRAVTEWTTKIRSAKKKFENDFKRMRDNMKFAAGQQWPGQNQIDSRDKYVANITNRSVNTKVASLYARNPIAEYQRRRRLDFQLYDGHLESLVPVLQAAGAAPLGLVSLPPQAQALIMDYQHGMQQRELIDKVGKTLEIVYQYQMDEQAEEDGEFKQQMKQLVRRVVTCGVGYVQVAYKRDSEPTVTSSGAGSTTANRVAQAKVLMEQMEEKEFDDESPKMQTLKSLMTSLSNTMQKAATDQPIAERLVIDCAPSTSIIPDPRCRSLKGFIGARWIAKEYLMPVEDINAIFDVDLKIDSGIKVYHSTGIEMNKSGASASEEPLKETYACLWEVFDKKTRTCFFIVDGHKEYVVEPYVSEPTVRGFWTIGALTFNDIETEPQSDLTIFPPSDVQLMKWPQKEWNRTRNELKNHRRANGPGWMTQKGMLDKQDKDALQDAVPNQVIELGSVPVGTPLNQVFVSKPIMPIDMKQYDTSVQLQDIGLTIGTQAENLGPTTPNATATGQTIAEQSRMTTTTSNVDDLDDLLAWMALVGGEMLLKEMQLPTVQRIAGPGAVFPQQNREDFLNQIYLTTKAASSGRPNQAIAMRNWQLAAPVLQAAGANPMFMVRETLRRLDDQLNPEEAFPLMPTAPAAMPQGGQHQPSPQEQHVPGQTLPPQQDRPGPPN